MPLYQNSVLKKYLKQQDSEAVAKAFKKFTKYFHDHKIQENIRSSKEEEYQGIFLTELFSKILGYTMKPNANFNLVAEYKNEKNSRKADGAILKDNEALGVIELKGTNTKDLEKVRQQAFDYKANQTGCVYVITSNFEKIRFYINNAVDFEEFDLFNINQERFELLYLCLAQENLLNNVPLKIKEASVQEEEAITKKFYTDYSTFKRELFRDLVKLNMKNEIFRVELNIEDVDRANKNIKHNLFKKSQKLIDRFLFIFFAEDRGLLPPNSTVKILEQWDKLKELDEVVPLYSRYKKYFNYLDTGRKGTDKTAEIFAYNGGLFKPDPVLDSLIISDELLAKHTNALQAYDFESQVDVNILGHIFENSLNEIESVNAEIEGTDFDKQTTKRKKDGVFYTPKYITKYIVDNTVGKLCTEKKAELTIIEEEFHSKRQKETKKKLLESLENYREWLLQLTILDPACGSGAFLNQALDFLIKEHEYVDELQTKLLGGGLVFPNIETTVLENNIYGVDLNEESIEIAKLSLWLRTAQPRRKLNDLSSNVKCGNSLIDSKTVAGDKAFKWEEEYPVIFDNGGFDVVIGNPPYVRAELFVSDKDYLKDKYQAYHGNADLYVYFYELGHKLINENGCLGYIAPNKWIESNYGLNLRKYFLQNKSINKFLDFGEAKIFDEVGTFPSLVFLSKKHFSEKIIFINFSDIAYIRSGDLNSLESVEVLYDSLGESKWVFGSSNVSDLLQKLSQSHNTLKEIIGDKLLAGVKTGANKLFIYSHEQVQVITKGSEEELKLFKAICFGKDIVKYGIKESGKYIFFPYEYIDGKQNVLDLSKFPYTFDHLLMKQGEMEKRAIIKDGVPKGTHTWYELQQINKVFDYSTPKIIYPDIALDNRFCLDKSGIVPDMTCFFIPIAETAFIPILNSKMFKFLAGKYCPVLGDLNEGGRIRYKTSYLFKIPFPEVTNTISNLRALHKLREESTCKFNNSIESFLRYIMRTNYLSKTSTKLDNWFEIEYVDFIKELNKVTKKAGGEKLTKIDEIGWMEVFEIKKAEAQILKTEIDKTDEEIDQMVYKLYGLTEEEIRVVENN
jgi:hypothetical protein